MLFPSTERSVALRGLLARLKRRAITDRMLTMLGFAFFVLCVCYIVWKRLPSFSFLPGLPWPFSSSPETPIDVDGYDIDNSTTLDDFDKMEL